MAERTRELRSTNAQLVSEIIERSQVEKELAESSVKNQALIKAIPDLLIRMDRMGTFLDMEPSDEFPAMRQREEVIGKRMADVMPDSVALPGMDSIRRALETGEIQMLEYQLTMPDGVHDYEARFTCSGDDEVLLVIRDITRRKQADAELQQAHGIAPPLPSLPWPENG